MSSHNIGLLIIIHYLLQVIPT